MIYTSCFSKLKSLLENVTPISICGKAPDWYVFPVSDTRAYRMIGNGWTVSVISWLLEHTKEY